MTIPHRHLLLIAASLALGAAIVGCKAKPAPPAGFIGDEAEMGHDPSLPFQRVWLKSGVDYRRYTKIYVAPVNTAHMLRTTEWQQWMRKEEFERDVENVALYMRNAMMNAFLAAPNQRFTVLGNPPPAMTTTTTTRPSATRLSATGPSASTGPAAQSDTVILELALIEVVPSKITLNMLGYAPFGIGMTINAVRGLSGDFSTVAFEARARDAATGEIIFLAADREAERKAPVDLKGLSWYSHAYAIIDSWAGQFVQLTQRKPEQVIKDTPTFRLEPW